MYFAGWTACTPTQELIRTIILCAALGVFVFSIYLIVKYLRSKGWIGLLLALIAIAAIAFVLYFATAITIFYFLGFCQ